MVIEDIWNEKFENYDKIRWFSRFEYETLHLQLLQILEKDLLTEETTMPVYFALETEELSSIYKEIHRGNVGDQAVTAVQGTKIIMLGKWLVLYWCRLFW